MTKNTTLLSAEELDELRVEARRGIGQRLTRARLLLSARLGRHVSRREIADAIGFRGQRRIMRYELGLLEPDTAITRLLCAVLGCDPRWVTYGDPTESTATDRPAVNYGDDAMQAAPSERAARRKARKSAGRATPKRKRA